MTNTWEERMAAKAQQRADERESEERRRDRVDWDALQESYVAAYAETLTPEKAAEEQKRVDENPIGCACIGGPVCCIIRDKARKRVLG